MAYSKMIFLSKTWDIFHPCSALLLITLMISGCSNDVSVTYYSQPPGANIVMGGANRGMAPVRLNYKLTKEMETADSLNIQGGYAMWKSGATATTDAIRLNLLKGRSYSFTFVRPQNTPGVETDLQFADYLRNQKLKQQRKEDKWAAAVLRAAEENEKRRLEQEKINAINRQTRAINRQTNAINRPVHVEREQIPLPPWDIMNPSRPCTLSTPHFC
jgi:hypothetical protein